MDYVVTFRVPPWEETRWQVTPHGLSQWFCGSVDLREPAPACYRRSAGGPRSRPRPATLFEGERLASIPKREVGSAGGRPSPASWASSTPSSAPPPRSTTWR
jgi:hypothetical protein